MWHLLSTLSKWYVFFVIGFSVYGSVATSSNLHLGFGEIIGSAVAGAMGFPLWGIAEFITGRPSAHDGNPIFELMKINSYLVWLIGVLYVFSITRQRKNEIGDE